MQFGKKVISSAALGKSLSVGERAKFYCIFSELILRGLVMIDYCSRKNRLTLKTIIFFVPGNCCSFYQPFMSFA